MEKEVKKLITSVESLLKLINNGDLIRNTSKDSNFAYYTKQTFRITNTLSNVLNSLKKIKNY